MTSLVVESKKGHDKASLQEVQPTSTQGDEASSPPQNVMKKRYNFRTLLGLSICVSATWETLVTSLFQGISQGGPAVLVWGFIIASIGAIAISLSLAEISSVWPTAGGQYHWTAALAPQKWRTLIGWYATWIIVLMTIFGTLTASFGFAMQIQSFIYIMKEDYVGKTWHVYLIFAFINIISLFINVFKPRAIHHISLTAMALHVLGFFAIVITLLATTEEKNSAELVFTRLQVQSGWSNTGIAFLLGMLPSVFSFLGVDVPSHFAEETEHPRTDVPRAMFWAVIINAACGLPFVLVLSFYMGDPVALLNSPIGALNPTAQIIINSTGSKAAAISLCAPIVLVASAASIDLLGSISRSIMAQARDNAMPFSECFLQIHPKWNVPVNAMVLTVIMELALGTIYIGNTTAYFGIASSTVALQTISYGIPIALHLLRRWDSTAQFGPWTLGRFGVFANSYAVAWYSFIFVIMQLPTSRPVTAANMNYASILAIGSLFIFTALYVLWGKNRYFGPLFSLETIVARDDDMKAPEVDG